MASRNIVLPLTDGINNANSPLRMPTNELTVAENALPNNEQLEPTGTWEETPIPGSDATGRAYLVNTYSPMPESVEDSVLVLANRTNQELPKVWGNQGKQDAGVLFPWQRYLDNIRPLGADMNDAPDTSAVGDIDGIKSIVSWANNVVVHTWYTPDAGVAGTFFWQKQDVATGALGPVRSTVIPAGSLTYGAAACYNSTMTGGRIVVVFQSGAVLGIDAEFTSTNVFSGSLPNGGVYDATTCNKNALILTADGGVLPNRVTAYSFNNILTPISNATLPGGVSTVTGYGALASSSPITPGDVFAMVKVSGDNTTWRVSRSTDSGATFATSHPFTGADITRDVIATMAAIRNPGTAAVEESDTLYGYVACFTRTTNAAAAVALVGTYSYAAHSADFYFRTPIGTAIKTVTQNFVGRARFISAPLVVNTDGRGRVVRGEPNYCFPIFFMKSADSYLINSAPPNSVQFNEPRYYAFTINPFDADTKVYFLTNWAQNTARLAQPLRIVPNKPIVLSSDTWGVTYGEIVDLTTRSVALPNFNEPFGVKTGISRLLFKQPASVDVIPQPRKLGRSNYFFGTTTAQYDGNALMNYDFIDKTPNLVGVATTGGNLTPGTSTGDTQYFYKVQLERQNARGEITYCRESFPFRVTLNTTQNAVNLGILPWIVQGLDTSYFTGVGGPDAPVTVIKLYRTLGSGADTDGTTETVYHTIESFSTASAFTYVDTLSDAAIESRLTAPANDSLVGVVTSTVPPFLSTTVWKQRIWGLSYNKGYNLYPSYAYVDTEIPESLRFSPDARIDVPVDVGRVRGLESIDDNVIVFGTDADFYISGSAQAKNNAELGDGVSTIGPMPSPGGMIINNAASKSTQGVIYQAEQGMLRLGRSAYGSYTFIGEKIKDLTDTRRFSRGTTFNKLNFITFADLSGAIGDRALAYNYVEDKWFTQKAVLGKPGNTAGAIRQLTNGNTAVVSRAPQGFYTYNSEVWDTMTVETPWLQPGGLVGYGDVLDMQLLGQYFGPHILSVEEAWDYGPYSAPKQQIILAPPSFYQYRFSPTQTQVKSLRYRIKVIPCDPAGNIRLYGKTARLFGLMLETNADSGLGRLENTRNR